MSNRDGDLIFLDWKMLFEDSKERVWYQEILILRR